VNFEEEVEKKLALDCRTGFWLKNPRLFIDGADAFDR
jgi:hypothetical protein